MQWRITQTTPSKQAGGNRLVQKERTRPADRARAAPERQKETGPLAGGVSVTFFAEPGSKRFV
jgi:hypothetical protein